MAQPSGPTSAPAGKKDFSPTPAVGRKPPVADSPAAEAGAVAIRRSEHGGGGGGFASPQPVAGADAVKDLEEERESDTDTEITEKVGPLLAYVESSSLSDF